LKQQSLAGRVNPYPFPNDQKGIPQGFGIFRLFHGFAALGHYSSAEKMAVRIFTSERTEQNAASTAAQENSRLSPKFLPRQ
jgi:hypothetical protein